MMLSNWTLHFTHAGPDMNETRQNVELRFSSRTESNYTTLREVLERRGAATVGVRKFTFSEVEQPAADADAEIVEPAQTPPMTPPMSGALVPVLAALPVPVARSANGDAERELSAGLLARDARFRLLVKGQIGVKEIERLIRKLELDKEILSEGQTGG